MSRGTKLRTVRVADDLWDAAREKAVADNRTLTDVVREALTNYARGERTA